MTLINALKEVKEIKQEFINNWLELAQKDRLDEKEWDAFIDLALVQAFVAGFEKGDEK